MGLADQLTVARIAAPPVIVLLYVVDFTGHDYWATGLFVVAMATDWFEGTSRPAQRPYLGNGLPA